MNSTTQRLPLSMVQPGQKVALVEFRCQRNMRHRLTELGMSCGDCVHVISGNCKGPMILGLKNDARLALGRAMADQIFVEIE